MTLAGTRALGTDMHSKTAEILGVARDQAKVFNYARIYGAGVSFAENLLKGYGVSKVDARAKAEALYRSTKGVRSAGIWVGGTESVCFNQLEKIARMKVLLV